MIAALVAGVPNPRSFMASASSSSSTNLPECSMAERSVASLNRGGGRVAAFSFAILSQATVAPFGISVSSLSVS